jgi:arylsulfatase A-like enzyme
MSPVTQTTNPWPKQVIGARTPPAGDKLNYRKNLALRKLSKVASEGHLASGRNLLISIVTATAVVGLAGPISTARAQAATDAVIGPSYEQSREAPRQLPKVANGPNMVWILLDDAGFGASSAYGGLVPTPTFDALADNGLRYTNFHTSGVCSPTRAALLTGRNHHLVGMGLFPHPFLSFGFPGYSGRMESKDGTIAEYLREAGYSTYAVGKWHLTPDEEMTDLGPFDRWPSGKGFDHFFGFLGGAEDQYKPDLVEDNTHIKPDGRHLNAQLVDKAIAYVDRQEKINPAKPFFLYFATGATHSPHQVGQEWIDKYKGRFDVGRDVWREKILVQQKTLGIIPADAKLPPRDSRVPAWDSLSPEQRRVYARFMEAYAGYMDYTDHELGRSIDHLNQAGLGQKTAIFLILGDNGASKEGGFNGTIKPEFQPPKVDNAAQVENLVAHIDTIGTAKAYTNYPMGRAQTADTPFREWKADANAEGATHEPLIVYWPGHIDKGIRTQYGHVIDLLPTALQIANAAPPPSLHGVSQDPLQGTSLVYSFVDANAPTRHTQQYYYLFESGAIVKDGWKASFGYRPDFVDLYSSYPAPKNPPNNAGKKVWELYDRNTDFNERIDLAAKESEKLKVLQALFKQQAQVNHAYPLINWTNANTKFMELIKANALPALRADANAN